VHVWCKSGTDLDLQSDSAKESESSEKKEEDSRFDSGAPGQSEHSEQDVEQKEKPKQTDDSDEGKPQGGGYTSSPKNLGEARKPGVSVSGNDGRTTHSHALYSKVPRVDRHPVRRITEERVGHGTQCDTCHHPVLICPQNALLFIPVV
jgi:hypothetical protein